MPAWHVVAAGAREALPGDEQAAKRQKNHEEAA